MDQFRGYISQLAIWEVEYNWNGTPMSLDGVDTMMRTGNFTYVGNTTDATDTPVTEAIRGFSSVILADWSGKTETATWLNSFNDAPSRQSLIAPPITGNAAAPEPSALALLLGPLGIVGAVFARRRYAG